MWHSQISKDTPHSSLERFCKADSVLVLLKRKLTYPGSPREFETTLRLKPVSCGFHSCMPPFQAWYALGKTSLPLPLSIPGRVSRVPGQFPISQVTKDRPRPPPSYLLLISKVSGEK